jgi:hypothetical protein
MDQLDVETLPSRLSTRRRWFWLTALLLCLAAGFIGLYGYAYLVPERRLRHALAEADRLDPGWRFEDLQAARVPIPDDGNSALVVIAAKTALPRQWTAEEVENELRELAPPVLLTVGQRGRLDAVLKKADASLAEARKLTALSRGRHPIHYKPDFISTLLPTVQDTRDIANLLSLDALARAQSGDGRGAVESCLAILNASRSLGDEPCLICQLVREACRVVAVRETERTLALGEPPAEALAALQLAFDEEEREPTLLWGLRGERAGLDGFFQFLQASNDKTRYLSQLLGGGWNRKPTPVEVVQLRLPGALKINRAAYVAYTTQLIEAARLPEPEQAARLAEIEATRGQQPVLVRLVNPFLQNIAFSHHRGRALLRAAAAGLAAERYRRTHGRWPETLAELVPEYLARVPADPYDGQPLRLRRFQDGIVAYAVGTDGVDDAGTVDWNVVFTSDKKTDTRKPVDWGIRLWDVPRRRQPPVAKPAPAEEKQDAKDG